MDVPVSRRTFLTRTASIGCIASGFLTALPSQGETARPRRLDRNNLLLYRSSEGTVLPVRSIADWMMRRAEIVRGMQQIMGPIPPEVRRCALDPQVEEETDCGTYVRRRLTYASEPGSRVPAYLLIPKRALAEGEKANAILCLHPTDDQHGHKVIVGLGGKANRQYAQELAERGYVTLAPAYPLLANYQPDWKTLGYVSGTMKAIWDNIRGLDLLATLPYVAKESFGAIGHSLGGHNAIFTAVFDERIKVVVSSCGLDSFLDYYSGDPAVWDSGRGWTSARYMPDLADYAGRLSEIPFDFHEVVAALAPRPCLISAPVHDSNFKWQSVASLTEVARRVFELFGAAHNLRVEHPDCGHDFPADTRQAAYVFLDQVLRE